MNSVEMTRSEDGEYQLEELEDVIYKCIRCGEEHIYPDTPLSEIYTSDCQCCEGVRKTILRKKIPEGEREYDRVQYFDKHTFKSKWLADDIMKDHYFVTLQDTDEILHYNEGIFHTEGDADIKKEVQKRLGDEATTHRVNETENQIRRTTYKKRQDIEDDIELICLKNGILNVKTKELLPHTPKYIFLNQLPIKYDPDARCPKILTFINQVVPEGDWPVIQELFGYCLWRNYDLDKAFLFIGGGGNGKSTLLNLLTKFLGNENVSGVALQDLDTNRFAVAELYGKMANIFADLPDRALKNTGKFKMLVGGDLMYGERKFKGQFGFFSYAVLIFSCNKVPETQDDTAAFYRRWIMLNFPYKFEGESDDPNILDKITTEEEMSGLLNWALEGLQRVLENGRFTHSRTTDEIREDYVKKSNPVLAFVEGNIVPDSSGEISKEELYRIFCDYCDTTGLPTKPKNVFGHELPRYATYIQQGQTRAKGTIWRGIAIRGQLDNADDPQQKVDDA